MRISVRQFRASAAALVFLTKRNGHEFKQARARAIVAAADEASEMPVQHAHRRPLELHSREHHQGIRAGKARETLFCGGASATALPGSRVR